MSIGAGAKTVGLVLLLVFAGACGGGGDDEQAAAPTGATENLPNGVTAAIATDGDVWGLTAERGALWVQVDRPVDAVVRIDTETHEITDRVEGGTNTAFDGESVWVARGQEVVRLDADSREIVATIPAAGSYIAVGEGAAWVSPGLTRIDPRTNKAVARIPIPTCAQSKEVKAGLGSVWVACRESGTVLRVDPRTNKVVATIPTDGGPHSIAFTAGAVWVTNVDGNTVSRISPDGNKVVASIKEVGEGVGIAAGMGYVWAASGSGIARIDPKTNTITGKLDPGSVGRVYYGIDIVDRALWVSTVDQRQVLRLDPAAF
jgi:virginiamycin B lyase